eukprot:Partr_v1_DN28171_c2_g1_i3_m55621 putative myeloid lymphoid or mixed-lineage leukemia (trithorax homolog, Drosophila)
MEMALSVVDDISSQNPSSISDSSCSEEDSISDIVMAEHDEISWASGSESSTDSTISITRITPQQLNARLIECPNARLAVISNILQEQFQLEESLLKRKLSALEMEIERGKVFIASLQRIRDSRPFSLPSDMMRSAKRACIDNIRTSATLAASEGRRSSSVYARRRDGVYVRFQCPTCMRTDFNSRVGFINHVRESHGVRFNGIQDCVDQCGVAVADSEIPAHDPCRWEATVNDFNDMDAAEDSIDTIVPTIKEYNYDEHEVFGTPSEVSRVSSCPSSDGAAQNGASSVTGGEDEDFSRSRNHLASGLTPLGLPSFHIQKDQASRFYVRRRVIIGSISEVLHRESDRSNPLDTHKWTVFVNCPNPDPRQPNKISSFVRSVKFYLHPSFKPNDVITCTAPPFCIQNKGWGECPIRVRLIFCDGELNRPVDLIHQLSLCPMDLDGPVRGPEIPFDIELDRATEFLEPSGPNDLDLKMDASPVVAVNAEKHVVHSMIESSPPSATETSALFTTDSPAEVAEPVVSHDPPVEKILPPNEHCKFCGSRFDVARFDWGLDSQKSTDAPKHDPNKCQFRAVTRKGKIRSIFTSFTKLDELCDSLQGIRDEILELPSCNAEDTFTFNINSVACEDLKNLMNRKTCDDGERQRSFTWDKFTLWPLETAATDLSISNFKKSLRLIEIPNHSHSKAEAEKVAALLYISTRNFLRELIEDGIGLFRRESVAEKEDDETMKLLDNVEQPALDAQVADPCRKILTPYHLYRTIYDERRGKYDFLTNAYIEMDMSGAKDEAEASTDKPEAETESPPTNL